MKGPLGYGRYDDDPDCVGCLRAKSDMTPCVARDGVTAADWAGLCVGCQAHSANLLRLLVREVTNPERLKRDQELVEAITALEKNARTRDGQSYGMASVDAVVEVIRAHQKRLPA